MESVEYLGFVATAFVLLSFTLDGNLLRWVNSIGALLWLVYGIFVGSYSIMFLNFCAMGIHMVKLLKPRLIKL